MSAADRSRLTAMMSETLDVYKRQVFHAVSDGMGAITFLKELTYRYIDLFRNESKGEVKKYSPSEECILDQEDSYFKHYRKKKGKG